MKKLIEFQESKHSEVLDVISKFRAENNVTFSEAVRRLIMLSQNGCAPEIYTDSDERMEKLEERFNRLHDIITTHIRRHTESNSHS